MSVRPHVCFICGINDASRNDSRYTGKDSEEPIWDQEFDGKDLFDGKGPWFFDKYFLQGNPESDFRKFPVVGYIIASGSEDLSRGLDAAFDWQTKDRIFVCPELPIPTKGFQQAYAMREGQDVVDSANEEHRWMETFTPWYTDLYYRRAIFLLHAAGWTGVTRVMLKFMIVSYWC